MQQATMMSPVPKDILESVSSWAEVLTVALSLLAAISGIVYVVATRPLRKIEAQEVQQERQKTAAAQAESAKAQLALKQYQDVITKSVNPRHLDSKRFIELLKGKPKGTAEIWYEPGDEEAHHFAEELYQSLGTAGAGWEVKAPIAFLGLPAMGDRAQRMTLRVAAESSGLSLATKKLSSNTDSMEWALKNAINLGVGGWGIAGLEYSFEDPALAHNHFVIAVGHHRVNVPVIEFTPPKQ
jgi:DNA-binding protein H-NS